MKSYVLSPQPASDASHQITTTRGALQNEQIHGVSDTSRRMALKNFRFDPVKYGAKRLGGGAYGTAYLMRLTQTSIAAIGEAVKFGGGVVTRVVPQAGMLVVVKVVKQAGRSDKDFYMENVRENFVHKRLSAEPCRPVPAASKPICVSKYVPKFYLSFIDGSPKKLESVTIMDVAGSMSLDKFVSGKKIPVDFFVDLERAICSMWLSGFVHGDLHRDNIMVDTRTKRIQIIDFGFAIKMPAGFVNVLSRRISNMVAFGHAGSLGDAWLQKPVDKDMRLINYSNRVMKGRGFPWYNPDYKILQSLFNQVPRNMRKNIPAARSAVWGIQLRQKDNQRQTTRVKKTSFASSPVLRASAAKTYRTSTQKPRTQMPPQKPRTPTPSQKPRKTFFVKKQFTNAERAVMFGGKRVSDMLKKRKEECSRRGLMYNPITKQCTSVRQRQEFAGCRQDCARIGKRCGPRGRCVKL